MRMNILPVTVLAIALPAIAPSAGAETIISVVQTSYDSRERVDCTTTRMNPATFGTLPANACDWSAPGSLGADRRTRNLYDATGKLISVTVALGEPEQAYDRRLTYTPSGLISSVTDGENNRTDYVYDGFDRLVRTNYPVTSQGQQTANTADYEQLTLDANGNVTQRRVRDGQVIGYAYDALNRLVSKDRPNVVYWETDQTYAYDLLGNMTQASDSNGRVLTFGYDALGRRTSQGDNWYPYGNATDQFDVAGRRTRMTWADGNYITYDYLANDAVSAIRDGAGNALVTFGYDDLGRRTSLSRANGTVTSYSYDPVSRLSQLVQNLAGTASDQTVTLGYNPASQITSRTGSNDSYAWTGHYNVDRPYGVNGLNQLTSAGATALGYDARGNLTTSGSTSYSYTADNQMAVVAGIGLAYDPLGRLFNGAIDTGMNTTLTYDGADLIAETNQSNGALLRRYVYGPGTDEPLIWYEGTGFSDPRWLHADERGSIVAVTNGAGTAIAINRFDEYGIPQSGGAGRFQYTGQKWLSGLGLYDYKARMYSPTLGRFMQTDPIGYDDGMNWYNYVGSDPVNKTDSSGMDGEFFSNFNNVPQSNDNIPLGDIFITGTRISSNTFSDVAFSSQIGAAGSMGVGSGISGELGNANFSVVQLVVLHYGRNALNHPPRSRQDAIRKGWIKQSDAKNLYHRFGPNGASNEKYLSPDGHQEAVYDKNGDLVTQAENMGTYNFASPDGISGVAHIVLDVLPYYVLGNSPNDKTNPYERVFGP